MKRKKTNKEEHKRLCGLYKATHGPALVADEKSSVCFPQLSSSFCTSTPWSRVRLQVSDLDHGLRPEPSASQRDEGQRELCFPKANPGITAMVTSTETQKLCQFNWCKSVPLSHWNLTCTFQLVTLDNTY